MVLGTLLWEALLEQGVGQGPPQVPAHLGRAMILQFCIMPESYSSWPGLF